MTPAAVYIVMAIGAVALYLLLPGGQVRRHVGGALVLLACLAALFVFFADLFSSHSRAAGAFFYIFSAIALIAAVRVITHTRPVYAVLYFVLVILASAGLVLLLDAQFLAVALVIIYAGAIVVTYIFVLMLAQQGGGSAYDRESREPLAAVALGFVMCATVTAVALRPLPQIPTQTAVQTATVGPEDGNVAAVGRTLLTQFAVGLEIAGLLLLVAMVGAIAIATKKTVPPQEGSSG